jgi:hypothetical protein
VLVDIVAHPEHQSTVDARLIGELRTHRASRRHGAATGVTAELRNPRPLCEGRRAHDQLSVGVHYEGVAIEHQLILTTYQVHVDEWQSHLPDACTRDLLTLALLVDLIWRGVDDHE